MMQFSEHYKQLVQEQLHQRILKEAQSIQQEILLSRTQKLFGALCFFLITQSFTIPVLPIGPWAAWPCLSDFAIAYFAIIFFEAKQFLHVQSPACRFLLKILVTILIGSILSYIFYVTSSQTIGIKGANFGIFQIYRLIEFIFVFWVVAHIPLDKNRLNKLRQITVWVLFFVCTGIFLTYFSIVPLSLLGVHLPKAPSIAGPWSYYAFPLSGEGWGTIGYSHAYVSVQVILLTGLYLHLDHQQTAIRKNSHHFKTGLMLIIATIACFLSGSRSGLAAMLILAFVYWLKKPIYVVTVISIGLLTFPFVELMKWALKTTRSSDGFILDRQLAIFDAMNPEHLSGRDEIWQQRLDFLDAEPLRWIFGSGFGSAVSSGNFAHMLPLHITLETGLLGLTFFLFLFGSILYLLYRFEVRSKALFVTTVVLLLSCISQETFYPVPAQGHFLGFYLCCLAITLRQELEIKHNWFLSGQDLEILKSPIMNANILFLPRSHFLPRRHQRRKRRQHAKP